MNDFLTWFAERAAKDLLLDAVILLKTALYRMSESRGVMTSPFEAVHPNAGWRDKEGPPGFPGSFAQRSFDRIARLAARQFSVPIALLVILDKHDRRLLAVYGLDAQAADRHADLCARLPMEKDIVVIPDARRDSRLRNEPIVNSEPGIRFYASVPIRNSDGRCIGTLRLMDVKLRPPLTDDHRELLSELAAVTLDEFELYTRCVAITDRMTTVQKRRTETERSLAVAKEQLSCIIEHAPAGIAILNRRMEYIAVSRRWREDFDPAGEKFVGRSHYDVFPEIPKSWKAEHRRCLEGEALNPGEAFLQLPDGSTYWVCRKLRPWFDEFGTVGGIILFNDVVTAQKLIADELERSKRFLNAVLESIKDGIIACDEEGRLNVFNAAAMRMHGLDLDDIPPEQWSKHYHLYEGDGKTALKKERIPLFRALKGEVVENAQCAVIPNGRSPRQLVVNARPLLIRSGATIGAVATMQDVTEQREIEARFRQSQKMEAVGQLTGGLAHDFNNLLAVILGNLQLLQNALKDDQKSAHRVAAAILAARRGADLTSRLLAFARRQALEEKAIDVNELIMGLKELLSRTLGTTIRCETALDKNLWPIYTDEAQLQGAILNLAINARDAMEVGGRLTIQTRNVTFDEPYTSRDIDLVPGDYVVISIIDSGCGMSEAIQAKAFEPFFTTKDVGKGTGLGLSTVYGFIRQSEGHIDIQSEEGRGTSISMYFPRTFQPVASSDGIQMHETGLRSGSERILVVEDNPAVREVTVALLEDVGYRVSAVESGQVALDILNSSAHDFDLLLTDVVMPGTPTGPALANIVRKRYPDLKVIFTSAYASESTLGDSRVGNGVELLKKPYCQDDLLRIVREALGRPSGQIQPA